MSEEERSFAERVAEFDDAALKELWEALTRHEVKASFAAWGFWSRKAQREPPLPWATWLMLAGRGFGKTRSGAEWVRMLARRHRDARIALVGATMAEVRAVMVEGDSGLLAVCAEDERPEWEPSLKRLHWPGGARVSLYSAAEPDSLRGPQHHFAWADEIAKWERGEEAWTNLRLGLRCGDFPRVLATTTPRPVALVRRLLADPEVVLTRGRTVDNRAALPPAYLAAVNAQYGGTRLGRQELDGELIEDVEGALWTRDMIEACRVSLDPSASLRGACARDERELVRIVVGVDPPASATGDACGIVAVGLTRDEVGFVLGDYSVRGLSPEGWAAQVAAAAAVHRAELVVAEANNGGTMVDSVLRAADCRLPVRLVHATRGKAARAEPVAMLYAKGRVKHAGAFPELEDELAGGRRVRGAGALARPRRCFGVGGDRADAGPGGASAADSGALAAGKGRDMPWFGRKAARETGRPFLLRGWGGVAPGEAWPRSYEAQVREAYLGNPVAQRAVRLVAEGCAGASIFDAGAGGGPPPPPAAVPLIATPAGSLTGRIVTPALLETVALHLLLHGNAFMQILCDAEGEPAEMFALRPERVAVEADAGGWPAAYLYKAGEARSRIAARDGLGRPGLVHVRAMHPLDDHYGLGCLGAAAGAVAIHNAATRWNKALLDNAARPSGALVYAPGDGAVLAAEQYKRLKAEMEAGFQGAANAGRPMLLEGGLSWQAMSLSPADMDFVALKAAAAREIALAFGVPPMLLGLPGDATYANYREANRALWRLTILPLAGKILGSVSMALSAWWPGVKLEVDLDRISELAEDRERLWAQVSAADFLTREEKREVLGFDRLSPNGGPG